MRLTIILSMLILLVGCNSSGEQKTAPDSKATETTSEPEETTEEKSDITSPPPKLHANERFREVMVERIAEHSFRIRGQARVFEATVNWVVEDGHVELKEGFVTADTGGPDWGAFDFTLDAEKIRSNSTLMLVLFELSAKDGSRQGELPIPLY